MTRNLRAFGLALVAMLAFGGIAAQGASAVVEHSFRSGALNADTVLTGQNESYTTGGSKHVFTATPGLTVSCDATFVGRNAGTTLDEVTVRPEYHNCTASTGGEVKVDNTGCDYEFDSDTSEDANHSSGAEHAKVSLDCEHVHGILITVVGLCTFKFEDTHTGSSDTVNQSLSGVRYTQVTHSGKHALTVNATVRTIKYTVLAGSFCGLAGHAAGTYSSGGYDGLAEVTGYEFSEKLTGSSQTTGTTYKHSGQVPLTISTPT